MKSTRFVRLEIYRGYIKCTCSVENKYRDDTIFENDQKTNSKSHFLSK